MNDSIENNNNKSEKINNVLVHENQKIVTILKHFLDFFPTILIKLIFEKNIINCEKELIPFECKFNSCFLYIDISEINKDYIEYKNNLCKEFYEYIYSYINKELQELANILIDFGCDFIFYGTGVLAFFPPNFDKDNFIEEDITKIINNIIKILQCTFEIKKKFFESKKLVKVKMGISFGECKLIILDNKLKKNISSNNYLNKQSFKNLEFIMSEKNNQYISKGNNFFLNLNIKNSYYYYFLFGKCIGDCCHYAKIGEEGQISIDQIIYNYNYKKLF